MQSQDTHLENLCGASLDECIQRGHRWFFSAVSWFADRVQQDAVISNDKATMELIGDMYCVLGIASESLYWYRCASHVAPDDFALQRQFEEAQEVANHENVIRYSGDEISGDVDERLSLEESKLYRLAAADMAKGKADLLPECTRIDRPWSLFLCARYWSILDDPNRSFAAIWRAIVRSKAFSLSSADWFYLSAECWEQTALWKALYEHKSRVYNLGLANFDRSSCRVGPPEVDQSIKRSMRRANNLVLRFHLLRTRVESNSLRNLAIRYPQWDDASFAVKFLEENGRCPSRDEMLAG